jgi:hypothetical protein
MRQLHPLRGPDEATPRRSGPALKITVYLLQMADSHMNTHCIKSLPFALYKGPSLPEGDRNTVLSPAYTTDHDRKFALWLYKQWTVSTS